MCIYIYIYTLNNRFLGNLFFKPLDKLLGGDFPKSCETFLVLCWGGRWEFHVWIPPSLLQHYPNLQNCTANKETPKKRHFASLCRAMVLLNTNTLSLPLPPPQDLMPTSQAGLQVFVTKKTSNLSFLFPVDAYEQLKY